MDIVYKYTAEEARELCRMGEIPAQFASANAAETLAEDETGMTDAFEFSFDEI